MSLYKTCGGVAFCHLCQYSRCDIEKLDTIDGLFSKEETSFEDFHNWARILGRKSECLGGVFESGYEPFIAHISIRGVSHFVMVYRYNWLVCFIDVDGRKHYLLKFIFDWCYTGMVFRFVDSEKS